VARPVAIAAVMAAASLLAVAGAGGAPAQSPKRGGTVVFGPIGALRCMNPLLFVCGPPESVVLAGAFAFGPDFTPQPRLVSRVRFTTSLPFTLTYSIRPEARWSDGVAVSARDFVFTHEAILERVPADPADRTAPQETHLNVQSVRAVDAKTVRVVLRSRYAAWRQLFPFVLPRHALVGEDLQTIWSDGVDNPKTGAPIGNGPFLVQRFERGKQLTLIRNPRYWGPHPAHLDRIVLRFCECTNVPPATEVLEAFQQGEADFVVTRETGIVPDLRRVTGVRAVVVPTNGLEQLTIRSGPGGHPALRQKLVRRALAYSIDRLAIVRRLFGDVDSRYPPSDSAIFSTHVGYYRPNWKDYRYRPTVARRLLEQAGCTRGPDGIYSCSGERLEFRLATPPAITFRVQNVQLIQNQMKRVGVDVALEFTQPGALFTQVFPNGDFDLVANGWFVDLAGTGTKDRFGCKAIFNYMGYCQRLVTADLDQADRILKDSDRARVLNRADRRMARDVPVIPLFDIPTVVAHRRSIRNFVPVPHDMLWKAENWWLER
jgi:peptide/nickel transport system substrate-binding protein